MPLRAISVVAMLEIEVRRDQNQVVQEQEVNSQEVAKVQTAGWVAKLPKT